VIVSLARIRTPIGELVAAARQDALLALEFADGRADPLEALCHRLGAFETREGDPIGLSRRFDAYLAGELDALDAVPVEPGGTPFQQAVWAELRRIRPGKTVSYADLAQSIGAPGASRAVGAANGSNPIAIVIPCHRVVRSDGSLGGYGGGMDRKHWLLRHERAILL
jgi:methylated-DNA-[protein]-cysteine S-methyltransferase